jgi:transcriptional regulator with XRE-family HTH domain
MGDRIKEMRKKLGLTQEALGKKAGVTKSTISKWETGEYVPAAFNIVELSKQLGVTSEWILRGQGAGTPKYRADHRGKFIARPIVNIPVIKLAQAHRAEELIGPDSRESEESKRMESITLPANLCPKDSYAIQLEHSIGKFDKGSYLIFSPTKSPSPD